MQVGKKKTKKRVKCAEATTKRPAAATSGISLPAKKVVRWPLLGPFVGPLLGFFSYHRRPISIFLCVFVYISWVVENVAAYRLVALPFHVWSPLGGLRSEYSSIASGPRQKEQHQRALARVAPSRRCLALRRLCFGPALHQPSRPRHRRQALQSQPRAAENGCRVTVAL